MNFFVILLQSRMFSNFELLMNKEIENYMKIKNIAWYSNFLMTPYDMGRFSQGWVEHFQMTR